MTGPSLLFVIMFQDSAGILSYSSNSSSISVIGPVNRGHVILHPGQSPLHCDQHNGVAVVNADVQYDRINCMNIYFLIVIDIANLNAYAGKVS